MITVLTYCSAPFEYEIFETDASKADAFEFVFKMAQANYNGENSNPVFDDFTKNHHYKLILSSDSNVTIDVNKIKVDVKIDYDDLLSLCDDIFIFKKKSTDTRGDEILRLINSIKRGYLGYDEYVDAFYTGDMDDIYIQFQDRDSNLQEMRSLYGRSRWASPRVKSHTWVRIWVKGELKFHASLPKYMARQTAIRFLENMEVLG